MLYLFMIELDVHQLYQYLCDMKMKFILKLFHNSSSLSDTIKCKYISIFIYVCVYVFVMQLFLTV